MPCLNSLKLVSLSILSERVRIRQAQQKQSNSKFLERVLVVVWRVRE